MLRTLTAKDLKAMLEREEDFLLINVLPEKSFEEAHIAGSYNLPHEKESFIDEVQSLAGHTTRKIVVYCASRDCQASLKAARKLKRAGFTNVFDFVDGIAGWRMAGYDIESAVGAAS